MCVLVVEDEPLILMMLVEELVDAGFAVREATTGDQAVQVIEHMDVPISLLVTDIHMPGDRDGVALAAYLKGRQPDVPIIYTTGRPDALCAVDHLGSREFLMRKPYVLAELVRKAEQLTDGSARSCTQPA